MINYLHVDNYRCFSGFEYAPRQVDLLLGDNGSGKTSVFDVLVSLRDIVVTGAPTDRVFPAESLNAWMAQRTQTFRLGVESDDGQYDYELRIEHDEKRTKNRITSETVTFEGAILFRFDGSEVHLFGDDGSSGPQFPFDRSRSAVATIPERHDNTRLTWFRRRLAELYVFSPDPPAMQDVTKKQESRVDRSMHNLVSWLYQMQAESFQVGVSLAQSLQEAIEGFSKHRFDPVGSRAWQLKVGFEFRDEQTGELKTDYELGFDQLSEGQRNLFALFTILHAALKPGSTVCIDEPDNFVALREIQPWLIELKDKAEESGCQCLLASHHPEMINYLAGSHGTWFSRDATGAARSKKFDWNGDGGLTPAEVIARGWAD